MCKHIFTIGTEMKLQEAFTDPDVQLSAMRTPQQEHIDRQLDALVAVMIGMVDHTLDAIGTGIPVRTAASPKP
jgi:hypothetical protein